MGARSSPVREASYVTKTSIGSLYQADDRQTIKSADFILRLSSVLRIYYHVMYVHVHVYFSRSVTRCTVPMGDTICASLCIFTARANARAVLGVVILSVRLSVCPSVTRVDCDKSKWCTADILHHTKGQSLCYLTLRVVGRRRPLPSEIYVQSDPPPSKNADFDRFPLITSQP